MEIDAADTGPAQVVGQPGGLDALDQRSDRGEIGAVERIGTSDRQRHPVHDHGVVGTDAIEVMQRLAARDQIVFGEHFKPVDRRQRGQDGFVMLAPQPQAEALNTTVVDGLRFHRTSSTGTGRKHRAETDGRRSARRPSTGASSSLSRPWRRIRPWSSP